MQQSFCPGSGPGPPVCRAPAPYCTGSHWTSSNLFSRLHVTCSNSTELPFCCFDTCLEILKQLSPFLDIIQLQDNLEWS